MKCYVFWFSSNLLLPQKTIKVESISLRDFALACLVSSWNSFKWDNINSWWEGAHSLALWHIVPWLGIILPQNFLLWWWLRNEHRLMLSNMAVLCYYYRKPLWNVVSTIRPFTFCIFIKPFKYCKGCSTKQLMGLMGLRSWLWIYFQHCVTQLQKLYLKSFRHETVNVDENC